MIIILYLINPSFLSSPVLFYSMCLNTVVIFKAFLLASEKTSTHGFNDINTRFYLLCTLMFVLHITLNAYHPRPVSDDEWRGKAKHMLVLVSLNSYKRGSSYKKI